MGYQRLEIPVVVEQGQLLHYAVCSDEHIDGFLHRYAELPETAVVPGALNGDPIAAEVVDRKFGKKALGCFEIFISPESLKNLGKNQVAHDDVPVG